MSLHWPETVQRVVRLALRGRQIYFEYDLAFLASGIEISPLNLKAKLGVMRGDPTLEGLPGVFHDSLPDNWGRLLTDRAALREGIRPAELTPLDRLARVGERGMGALGYHPEFSPDDVSEDLDLDALAANAEQIIEGEAVEVLDALFMAGGSPGGARPKVVVAWRASDQHLCHGTQTIPDDHTPLLVKFGAPSDPPDIGRLELAYAQMAQAAGVHMMPCVLLPSKSSPGYFGTERFDRPRVHVHTLSGLLHTDHRVPNLDYDHLLRVTLSLTRDRRELRKAFRLMAFNVRAHNRDDHGKQFSFLMDHTGTWTLAPAYDLTCADGPGGQHTMTINGEGLRPTRSHLLALGKRAGIEGAKEILDAVDSAVVRWGEFAQAAGVSRSTQAWVLERLNRCRWSR